MKYWSQKYNDSTIADQHQTDKNIILNNIYFKWFIIYDKIIIV